MSAKGSLGEKVLDSAVFMLIANVIRQSIGIVSMVILARLLSPDDYGLVAISLLVINFFDIFGEIGVNQYILSRRKLDEFQVQTAWTLRVLIRIFLAFIVVAVSPLMASFFERPELLAVLLVSAIVPVLRSLESPGLLMLRREFAYRRIALITVLAKIAGFITAVSIALSLGSYWALVIGDIVLALTFTTASYYLHPLRPRFSLTGLGHQWAFTRWNLVRVILGYTRSKVDNFVIGKTLGVADLGLYSLSKQLATLPHDQMNAALVDVITSTVMQSRDGKNGVANALSKILVLQLYLLIPFVVGLYMLAQPLIVLMLGEKWIAAVEIIKILALITLTFSMNATITTTLVALERVREVFFLDLVTGAILVLALITLSQFSPELDEFASARVLLSCFVTLSTYVYLSTIVKMPHIRLAIALVPVTVVTACMAIAIFLASRLVEGGGVFVSLLVPAVVGLIVHVCLFLPLLKFLANLTPELHYASGLSTKALMQIKTRFLGLLAR